MENFIDRIDLFSKRLEINQRRYIGNKSKLMPWISDLILKNTEGNSFFDVFAGTGSVTAYMFNNYDSFYINDFLYSNYVAFNAFFGEEGVDNKKINNYFDQFKLINKRKYDDSYFEDNYGGRFFSKHDAAVIGEIRERVQNAKDLNDRERAVLITSLIYSADRISNTVGHYDAYRKGIEIPDRFHFELIDYMNTHDKDIHIYREDANEIVKKVYADVVFLDPPYNSRQYSRFYHVLEQIAKWNKPKLYGVAMKPKAENMSEYSRSDAPEIFDQLVQNIHGKYIVVTYNNTYENAKSTSSRNKITHNQILESLNKVGITKVFNKPYKYFNAGNTNLKNHKETLFITEVSHPNE